MYFDGIQNNIAKEKTRVVRVLLIRQERTSLKLRSRICGDDLPNLISFESSKSESEEKDEVDSLEIESYLKTRVIATDHENKVLSMAFC